MSPLSFKRDYQGNGQKQKQKQKLKQTQRISLLLAWLNSSTFLPSENCLNTKHFCFSVRGSIKEKSNTVMFCSSVWVLLLTLTRGGASPWTSLRIRIHIQGANEVIYISGKTVISVMNKSSWKFNLVYNPLFTKIILIISHCLWKLSVDLI